MKSVIRHRTARFIVVGVMNTAVDFVVLFSMVTYFRTPILVANVLSTSVALIVSFLLNKHAVFRDADAHSTRQVLIFIGITLIGLWIVQGLIISVISSYLGSVSDIDEKLVLVIAKLVATGVTLVWNYILYSRFVFNNK